MNKGGISSPWTALLPQATLPAISSPSTTDHDDHPPTSRSESEQEGEELPSRNNSPVISRQDGAASSCEDVKASPSSSSSSSTTSPQTTKSCDLSKRIEYSGHHDTEVLRILQDRLTEPDARTSVTELALVDVGLGTHRVACLQSSHDELIMIITITTGWKINSVVDHGRACSTSFR